ncbi:MAG TPA: FAD-binding oxidoreductase [Thermoplasmata archaeon]|nr:FAD-binding oxidoreductase [Thermoplasmata archaeon]
MAGPRRADVLILGAGIAGCALAEHLVPHRLSVTVVDPGPRGGGATGRAAGILTEQLWNAWDIEVTREAHLEAARLLKDADYPSYWQNGFVRTSQDPSVGRSLRAAGERLRSLGVRVRDVAADDLSAIFPEGEFPEGTTGLFSPKDACVTPSTLADAYARSAQREGATFLENAGPVTPRAKDGLWLVDVGRETWSAPRLVVAAGAWSKRVLEGLGSPLPLCPYRMQAALLLPGEGASEEFPSIHDLDTDVYVRPETGGRVLAGDGTESVESDPETFVRGGDPSFVAHLAESLAGPFPSWGAAEVVSAWAGVCTATKDRRPLVGPVPGAPGLYTMTGFNGFGVMRAGGIARRLADALTAEAAGRPDWSALAPVLPERFPVGQSSFLPKPGFTLEEGDGPFF